ncbi:hypothetical protein [Kitasatospora sp. MBT66]|uniref:hypothetical protein n=1 Tax=Kitasatospora sp. MBT66 TaxID=1444769 RepID=UPI0005B9BEBB|nr:hypothetical protein [Kitasatospora sp. MBT66]
MSDDTGDQADADDQGDFRSVGVEVHCHPDVAADITRRLSEAAAEILAGYGEDEVYDWAAG